MAYGTLKCDNITFTNGGIDQTVTVSGIVQSISGDITATGTIQGATIIGTSTVSGATVTGDAGVFTTVTGGSAGFTTVTGTTVTGTTANFNVGTFTSQVSGATITGNLAQFTSVTGGTAGFTTVTGTTVTGTTANFVTVSGTTVTGNAGQFTTITGTSAGFTTITGATITGSVGNFGSGSAAAPSVSVGTTDNGIYSPGADQVAISTNGTGRLFVDASGNVGVGTVTTQSLHVKSTSNGTTARFENNSGNFVDFYETTGGTRLGYLGSLDNTNWTIHNDKNGYIGFDTNNTERLRITSDGKLGLGTNSPISLLHATTPFNAGGTVETVALLVNNCPLTSGAGAKIHLGAVDGLTRGVALVGVNTGGANNAHAMAFETSAPSSAPTERMRIDSSGRLLVGTSSARSNIEPLGTGPVTYNLQNEGTSSSTGLATIRNSADGGGSYFILGKTRGTAVNQNTVVANDDSVGVISFVAADGTNLVPAAVIVCEVDGTPGANDMPGRLVFSTTADGASSPTERMRIKADGSATFGMGAGTFSTNTGVEVLPAGQLKANATSDVALHLNRGADNGDTVTFRRSQTLVGSISVTASATAYNTSSDYRLKENVTAVTDGITRLQQLKPSRFNFIADPDTTVDGFIAHEVQTVVPEAITGEKDAVDSEGNPVYQGIDQSKLVPLLTAALQEAIGEIESLKARVAALETP